MFGNEFVGLEERKVYAATERLQIDNKESKYFSGISSLSGRIIKML